VFENAIYTESAEGKAHALWQAIDKSRHITWISRTRDDTRPEAHLLFGGDKFNIWLYESAEGNLIQSTFSIDGSPIIAHIEKEADSLYMQIIDDKEKRYAYRWNLTDNQLTKLYDAKSEHSLQESKQLMLLTSPVISILFGDIEIHSLNKDLKKWLIAGLVINFLIAIFTFFMFRRGESKASILTAMICIALLFGIPGLIALLICFDREQGMFIERTYPALTRKGGIVR
jgi:hypothetical protein